MKKRERERERFYSGDTPCEFKNGQISVTLFMNGPLGKKKLCENTKICAKSDSGKIMIVNIFNLFFN